MNRLFALVVLLSLTACATATQPRNQKIQITAVNGKDAKCILENKLYKTVAYPPQSVNVERSKYTLVIDCTAAEGKHRRLLVQPEHNPTSTYLQGPGQLVDRVTGSAWQYPPYIRIDFDYAPFVDPLNRDGRPPATARYSSGIEVEQLDPSKEFNQ